MAIELAKAYVQIIPTTNGITGMLNDELNGPAEEAGKEAGEKSGGGFVKTLSKAIAAGAAAVGTAAATMVKGIVDGTKATAAYGDNVDKMSQKIGFSAESYQKWAYVMERAGTNVDMLQTSMKTLSNAAESNSEAFKALGISEEEVANLSSEDLFGRVIEGLSGMEAGTERTALASSLLGKAATELGPLLNGGTEAIKEQMNMAEEYGMVMSNDAVAASAVFTDSLTTMQYTFTGLKNSLFSEFLPSLTQVTDGIALLMSGSSEGIEMIASGAGEFIGKISAMIPNLIEVVSGILPTITATVVENLPLLLDAAVDMIVQVGDALVGELPLFIDVAVDLVLSLVQGIGDALPDLIDTVTTIIPNVIDTLMDAIPEIIDTGVTLLISLVGNLQAIISGIINAIPTIITSICSKFSDLIPQIVDAGVQLFVALVQNLPKIIAEIVKAIPQIIKSLVSGFGQMGSQMAEVGFNLIKGIWNGISNAASWLWNLVKGWCNNLVGKIKGFFGIHSPSTVFAGIGDNMMLGLAGGIDDGADSVYTAIDRVTAATMGSINGSMTVNSALSMPEYQATSRMDEIVARLENLRIYLDGDTLVGGIANRMDRTLGINSGLAERGLA